MRDEDRDKRIEKDHEERKVMNKKDEEERKTTRPRTQKLHMMLKLKASKSSHW
jgi:hypothetical protein